MMKEVLEQLVDIEVIVQRAKRRTTRSEVDEAEMQSMADAQKQDAHAVQDRRRIRAGARRGWIRHTRGYRERQIEA